MAAAGAGVIGDYTHCSFTTSGTGRFLPGDDADPFVVDEDGRSTPTRVDEARVEVVVDRSRLASVRSALEAAHPYEEVAVDLYVLGDVQRPSLGRRGRLAAPATLAEVATLLRDRLPAPDLRVAGDTSALVHTVAAVGGAGRSMVDDALAADVDVFVTGDLGHHDVLDARTRGLAVIDAGHHAVEAAAMPAWVELLSADASTQGLHAPVVASEVSTRPWSNLPTSPSEPS